MKHYSLLKASAILLMGCIFLNSCSTSYQARRFSHLDYVKADKVNPPAEAPSLSKENVSPLSGNQVTSIPTSPDPNFTASVEQTPQTKPVQHVAKSSGNVYQSAPQEQYSSSEKIKPFSTITEQSKSIIKDNKLNLFKKPAPSDLMHDEDRLLLLWLICLGAAIVFYLLAIIAWPLVIIGALASIAALVFFILWIVAIAGA